jgi:hypothetical protein
MLYTIIHSIIPLPLDLENDLIIQLISSLSQTKLKNEEENNDERNIPLINPINLTIINNPDKSICLNKLNYNNNSFNYYNNNICNNNDEFIKKYMYIPPITINAETILNIYNINNIDDFVNYINNNLEYENINFYKINRILKAWVRINFDNLELYLNIIENLYLKILYKNFDIEQNLDLEKNIKDYIKYWIKKNNNNMFKLDLLNDIIEYYNKYIE